MTAMTTTDADAAVKPESWADVTPGQVIRVRKVGRRVPFMVRVHSVDLATARGGYAEVIGDRLTASGKSSLRRATVGYSGRRHLIHIADVEIVSEES